MNQSLVSKKYFVVKKNYLKKHHHNFVIPDFVCFGINTKKAFWVVFFGKKNLDLKKHPKSFQQIFSFLRLPPKKSLFSLNFDQDVHV